MGWQNFWGETRTRLLLLYLVILTLALGLSVPIFRYFLFADIDARVRRDMAEELEEFRNLLAGKIDWDDLGNDDADGAACQPEKARPLALVHDAKHSSSLFPAVILSRRKPTSLPPSTQANLRLFFDAYMAHRLPEDEVYLIGFVGGQFYKSSPSGRPVDLRPDAALMRRWAVQSQPGEGEQESDSPDVGSILYLVEPIFFQDQLLGVFVIAHSTAGERAEGLAATLIAARVILGLLLLALLLVWLAAGRVLQPLQTLATTVEAIGESNLTRRIPVHGKGELARLAAQFNAMMERLETAFMTQREFVNDASHELRTPITIIRGHLEVMEPASVEQGETLALVIDELDRMNRFVDDLILLAKAERPDFLQLETVDAAALMQELFAKAQALAPRNWQLEEIAQGTVTLDRQRLTQAVMSLVQNATQHTQETDTIALGSAIGRGKVHFWVRDTGTGIALTDQKRIFERFARASHQRRRSEGAGLGLSIVKAIAIAHGGDVTLRSKLGEGSTFAIVLPVINADSGMSA